MSRYSKDGKPSNDPRAEHTRQELKQAIIRVLGAKSFDKVSVNDITKEAAVNRATFYSHYPDKYDLLNSIIRDTFSQMMSAYRSAPLLLSRENLTTFILSVWEYMSYFSGSIGGASGQQFIAFMQGEVQAQIQGMIAEWLGREYKMDFEKPYIAAAVAAAIFNSGAEWGKSQDMGTRQALAETIQTMIIRGLTRYHSYEGLE